MQRGMWTFFAATILLPNIAFGSSSPNASLPTFTVPDGPSLATSFKQTSNEVGVSASEVMRGNGSRAGYILSHGGIIPGSEWVYVGLRRARLNTDYTIDYSNGSLYFTEPVRQIDSIKVDYRYSETAKGERSMTGLGAMPFKLGSGLQTNLTYSYRAADPDKASAADILTYGLSNTVALGGSSSLSSLMFISSPENVGRVALSAGTTSQKTTDAPTVKKDRLMVQDADLGLGKVVRLKLGMQDVGEDFAGFASMRESKSTSDDVIGALEREKGIKRTSVGLDVATGKSSGLSFSLGNISDKNDRIASQAFNYKSSTFKANFMTRDVGDTFSRFKDLREADKGQFAAEAGIRRTSYGLGFASGATTTGEARWSGLNMTRLTGDAGDLTIRSAEIDLGSVKVQTDMREMAPQFNKMTALSDEERTRMAMIARRQFDPNAQVAQISAKDKAQINNEAGINRRNVGIEIKSGTGGPWLGFRLANVDSQNGGISRKDINFEGKSYSLYFNTHDIDDQFDRIAHMQAVEQARFGNERGMSRTETGGTIKLGFGDLALAHAGVRDHQGASVSRNGIDLKTQRLKLHANFQSIDPEFSRIMDLSDADREKMVQEKGFRRSDYAINFQATKTLNIDTYIYDSTNSTAEQTRSQNRYAVTYAPTHGPQMTVLSDRFSYYSDEGNLSSYSHQKVTFDNKLQLLGGLLFRSMHDSNTTQESTGMPVTTEVTQTHLESDQSKGMSYTVDTLQRDFGDNNRFEETWEVGAKTQLARRMKLTGGFARTAREADNSEVNGRVGFDWQVKNDLSVGISVANRAGGPEGSRQSRQFSMKGMLAKRLLMFKDVNVDSGMNTTQLRGKQVSCDNGLRVNAGFLNGKATFDNSDKLNAKNGLYYTSRVVQYETSADPARPYRVTFFRQNLITPSGEPAQKRSYVLDLRLSRNTGIALASYYGKDGQNGVVLPLGGTTFKITRALNQKLSLAADLSADRNETTSRHARTIGFGVTGTLTNTAVFEFYTGWCHLIESGPQEHDRVYRLKYDRKIDADHYLSLSAQKKSAVERSSINPFEGDTTARIDYKTLFN